MTRIQVNPNKQKPRLVFDRDLVPPDLAPRSFLIDTSGCVFQTSICTPQARSVSCPEETIECEASPMHHWPEPNGCRSTDLDDITNESLTSQESMGDDFSYWSEVLTSTSPEESKAQVYDGPGRSQDQDPFMQNVRKIDMTEDHEQHEQSAAHSIKREMEETQSDDVILSMAHPIPKLLSTYVVGSNFTSFSGPETSSGATSLFSTPDDSLESLPNCEIGLKQEWAAYGLEIPAFPRRSPEESPAVTVNNFIPVSGPATLPPWPTTLGAQAPWDVQHQSPDRGQVLWVGPPYVLSTNGLYDHGNGGFDHAPIVNKGLNGLPLQGHEYHDYTQHAMSYSQSKLEHLDFAFGRKPCAVDQRCTPAQFCHENPYTHHFMHPKPAIHGSHLPQEQLNHFQIAHHSENRDGFLVELKRRGFSYKTIKRIGDFKEAESTLRGRFRTLTKSKDQRVRKPRWHEKDIMLLCDAVNAFLGAENQGHNSHVPMRRSGMATQVPKVSWKQVGQYIWAHGGSYHFGNATCKKKWCEIHGMAWP
ncbi:hypothetical protein BBP40_004606 [Aspergillus hancockii]|nr:hypothetical protein BBP40_004606 [Aspergillus hancockii]